MAKKRGRPPIDGTSKEVRVEVRVSESERDTWDRIASTNGWSLSEWIRKVLNEETEKKFPRSPGNIN